MGWHLHPCTNPFFVSDINITCTFRENPSMSGFYMCMWAHYEQLRVRDLGFWKHTCTNVSICTGLRHGDNQDWLEIYLSEVCWGKMQHEKEVIQQNMADHRCLKDAHMEYGTVYGRVWRTVLTLKFELLLYSIKRYRPNACELVVPFPFLRMLMHIVEDRDVV